MILLMFDKSSIFPREKCSCNISLSRRHVCDLSEVPDLKYVQVVISTCKPMFKEMGLPPVGLRVLPPPPPPPLLSLREIRGYAVETLNAFLNAFNCAHGVHS